MSIEVRNAAKTPLLVTKFHLVTGLLGKLNLPFLVAWRPRTNQTGGRKTTRREAQLRGQVRSQVELGNENLGREE